MNKTLKSSVEALGRFRKANVDFSDDALIYAGSAKWDDWRNHVPVSVQSAWRDLNEDARAALYITAEAVTRWKPMSK